MTRGQRIERERRYQQSQSWPARLGQALDRAILAVAPAWGIKRLQARTAASLLSAYVGAEGGRLRKDWSALGASADADILNDLPTLRNRSRDLNRNNAHAAAITNAVVVNVVGSGIRPQARPDAQALGLTPDHARRFTRQAERAWRHWVPWADSQGRLSFYGIESLVQRQILENGEVLVLPLMVKDEPWRPFSLALEVIEADRLETPPEKRSDLNIRDGVELGARGQPVAYWIRKRHPGDLFLGRPGARLAQSAEYVRYPAFNAAGRRNVFHLYWMLRPGQTRGVPFFAPTMAMFKDLADYMEAELVAARVAACFAAFVKKNDPMGSALANATGTTEQGQRVEELEPGMIDYLQPGEDVVFANPNRPGGTYEPFLLSILRAIGSALGLPLELVLKDFSKVNYASARAAILEARRFFKGYQEWLAQNLCQPIWEMVLEEAWLRERLDAVNLFGDEREDWMRTRWIAPGWGWVDPVKEVTSSKLAIENNLSSLADECASQGRDWEEVLEQRQREVELMRELGVPSGAAPGPAPAAPTPSTEDEPEREREDPDQETQPEEEAVR
ncbi:phage portal protein [Candidatus Nitrospira bockiana]